MLVREGDGPAVGSAVAVAYMHIHTQPERATALGKRVTVVMLTQSNTRWRRLGGRCTSINGSLLEMPASGHRLSPLRCPIMIGQKVQLYKTNGSDAASVTLSQTLLFLARTYAHTLLAVHKVFFLLLSADEQPTSYFVRERCLTFTRASFAFHNDNDCAAHSYISSLSSCTHQQRQKKVSAACDHHDDDESLRMRLFMAK